MDVDFDRTFKISELIELGLNPKIHTITIKKNIWVENGIRVTEKCFYEDFQYSNYALPFIKTVAYLDYPVYYYLTEQKTQSVSDSSTYKNIHMFVKVYQDADKYFSALDIADESVRNFIDKQMIVFLRQTYNVFLRNTAQKDLMEKFKMVDSEIKDTNFDRYNKIGQKYSYIKMMRKGKKATFKLLSMMFRIYKKA